MVRVFRRGLPFRIGRRMEATTLNRASGGDFAQSLTRRRLQVEDRAANGLIVLSRSCPAALPSDRFPPRVACRIDCSTCWDPAPQRSVGCGTSRTAHAWPNCLERTGPLSISARGDRAFRQASSRFLGRTAASRLLSSRTTPAACRAGRAGSGHKTRRRPPTRRLRAAPSRHRYR